MPLEASDIQFLATALQSFQPSQSPAQAQCPRMKMNKSFENQQRDLCREVQHASEVPKNYSL